MRVAIMLLNRGRGSGGVAKEHGAYLIDRGHEVYYMHPGNVNGLSGGHNVDIKLHSNVLPVHEYLPSAKTGQKAVSTMNYDEAMAYLPSYERALEDIIEDLDIVIGHHANLTAIATSNVCRKYNKPYVLFLHGTGIEPRHHGQYDDRIWQQIEVAINGASGIIVTTEYVRDRLIRNMVDVPMEKFLIQPCGVDMKEFHPNNVGNMRDKYNLPDTYVICPGALTISKGPQNVVKASTHYSDLSETIFIGGGDIMDELQQRIGDGGRFLGFVPNEDKAQLINGATLLVAAPEKKEHFGIIYVEAMAAGVPSVAYEGGGVNSIVTESVGVLTNRDSDELGKTIRSILTDENRYNELKSHCRDRANRLYATDVLGSKLIDWLSKYI